MRALDWIAGLEAKRDKAEKSHNLGLFELISKEISATIGGKYGISKRVTTKEERQRIVASILRTRDHFSGMPDIVNQMYFSHDQKGCWKKLHDDKGYSQHIGAVLAADAILFGTHNREGFGELFEESVLKKSVSKELVTSTIETVLDIHSDEVEEPLRGVMNQLGQESWRKVVEAVGSQMETLAPRFTLSQIFTELYVSGDEGYKRWTPHKLGHLVNWFKDGNEGLRKVKKSFLELFRQDTTRATNFIISPLSSKAILVDDELGKRVIGSDYQPDKESALVVIPYACFLPLMHEAFSQEPIVFYMTKKISFYRLSNLFLVDKVFSLKEFDKNLEESVLAWQSWRKANVQYDLPVKEKKKFLQTAISFGLITALNNYGLLLDEDGFVSEGLQYLKMGADRGNIDALKNYFMRSRKLNPLISNAYLKIGVIEGDKRLHYEYARNCYHGIGRGKDLIKARAYFKRAADDGVLRKPAREIMEEILPKGLFDFNFLHLLDRKLPLDAIPKVVKCHHAKQVFLQEEISYAQQDPEKGIPTAQFNYALMAYQGEGGPVDLVEARKYYKLAADQNHSQAQYEYALMAYNGEGGPKDLTEARKYSKLAADQNHSHAQYEYALMVHEGKGGPVDLVEARKYYKLSADQNYSRAQRNYAVVAWQGVGGPVDLVEARKYYKLSADHNDPQEQCNYALIVYLGLIGPKDLAEARKYFKLAVDKNLSQAQYGYAVMVYHGEGGPKDLVEARKYFKLSADQNNSDAQKGYALMLDNGEGGEKNKTLARHYYKLSADSGDIETQFKYAVMSYEGIGGSINLVEARKYFKLAADQNHSQARLNYLAMVSRGEGESQ